MSFKFRDVNHPGARTRTTLITMAATAAIAVMTQTRNASASDLAIHVSSELYSTTAYGSGANYNPGIDYSIGWAFEPAASGTEITAVNDDLMIGHIVQNNANNPNGFPDLTSDTVRIYESNSTVIDPTTGLPAVTLLDTTTVYSTDPINSMTTGGATPPTGEQPNGGVITYNQHKLAKPLILFPQANVTYYVDTDIPAGYAWFNSIPGPPPNYGGAPNGITPDSTIASFIGEVSQRTAITPNPVVDRAGGDATGTGGYYGGVGVNLTVQSVVITTPANLTWTDASENGLWDTSSLNFSNGSGGTVAYNDTSNTLVGDGDNVTFNDNNGGAANYNVSIPAILNPSSTTISNSAGNYFFNGSGGIAGPGGLTKSGTSSLTLAVSNTYTGLTNISGGTLILGVAGALPSGTNLNIAAGASVVAGNLGTAYALTVGSLAVAGRLDLNNNDLIVHNSSIGAVTTLLASGFNSGRWNGASGIISTAAAGNSSHLTTLGVIVNDNGSGTPLYGSGGSLGGTFGGSTPVDGDVLVKYTYYGDTNLDGKVDGSDYSRIDSAYLADQTTPGSVTGWSNGDFNYDGVINGSDYTLIDNAFNTQGAQISAELSSPLASSTAEIAGAIGTSAVPEPTTLGLLAMGAALLSRRRLRR